MSEARQAPESMRFTVGSISCTDASSENFDLTQEIELLKTAILYGDRVKLFSAGSSILSGFVELRDVPRKQRLELVRKYGSSWLTPDQIEKLNLIVGGSREQRRRASKRGRRALETVVDDGWKQLEDMVETEFETYNARGLADATSSGMVELHSFEHTDAEGILRLAAGEDHLVEPAVDDVAFEYIEQTFEALQAGAGAGGGAYPLFDTFIGDFVDEAVREGLILPSTGAIGRSRHAGLAGDVLSRLPTFEEATIAEVLDIRRDLKRPLRGFRGAIADYSREIRSAAWEPGFAEEAEALFRESISPRVTELGESIEENRALAEFARRMGRHGVSYGGLGAVIGDPSGFPSLTGLALGLGVAAMQARMDVTQKFESLQGNQLYFYHRTGERLQDQH